MSRRGPTPTAGSVRSAEIPKGETRQRRQASGDDVAVGFFQDGPVSMRYRKPPAGPRLPDRHGRACGYKNECDPSLAFDRIPLIFSKAMIGLPWCHPALEVPCWTDAEIRFAATFAGPRRSALVPWDVDPDLPVRRCVHPPF